MAIQAVCECGFEKRVPDDWKGKKVKCRCGRTFVVGDPAEEPVQADFDPADLLPPSSGGGAPGPRSGDPAREGGKPPAARQPEPPPASPRPTPPPNVPELPEPSGSELPPRRLPPQPSGQVNQPPPPASVDRKLPPGPSREPSQVLGPEGAPAIVTGGGSASSVARYRSRRRSKKEWQMPVIGGLAVLAVVGMGAVIYVLKIRSASNGIVQTADPQEQGSKALGESDRGTSLSAASSSGARNPPRRRVAEPVELGPDDGLLLTGIFGDHAQQLELTEDQQKAIGELVEQLKKKEDQLRSRELAVDQWSTDCLAIATQLLELLDDSQRERLRQLIQQGTVLRVELANYASQIRPELSVPSTEWNVTRDGERFQTIESSSIAGPAPAGFYRAGVASGAFGVVRKIDANQRQQVDLWNTVEDRQVGGCSVPASDQGLVSRDGRHLVIVRNDGSGGESVEVWAAETGKLVASKPVPNPGSDEPNARYVVRDCVASHVFAVSGKGYWAWDFSADETLEIEFPGSGEGVVPETTISAGGRYLAATHSHHLVIDSKDYHFLEVCVYQIDTGQLLGNQVLEKDYLPTRCGAMAFSPDGRELALLWDFAGETPARSLVRINVRDGEITMIAPGLPPADQGYARRHELMTLDLIWLPENAGWVVNLQNVVDAETEAVLDIEIPGFKMAQDAGSSDSQMIVDAVAADIEKLLVVIVDRTDSANPHLRTEMVPLPQLGPFM